MRFLFLLTAALIISMLTSCSTSQEQKEPSDNSEQTALSFPERAKDMVMYEVNVRQYTPEGTIPAFIPHMERLKNMGIDILWIMPIQPIGVEKRKGSLGSYYSISDYKKVNEEFGTMEDFKAMVNKAHELDMLVILDWVANHTAWDHPWMTEHPEWYTTDSLGNVIPPDPGWQDVADLNYENEAMRKEMANDMLFWITETDLDGFRCDVAWGIDPKYWNEIKDQLDQTKDLFMLAEADDAELHNHAFHATYTWEFHHKMTQVGKGEDNADSIDMAINKDFNRFSEKAFRLSFTSNHDENSWKGSVYERYGNGAKTMAVLSSTVMGMPLLYSGQEAGLDKRLRFFDKDTIDWSELPLEGFYKSLHQLKKNNEALWSGEYGGQAERINKNNNTTNIYAFKREKNGNQVIVLLNLSDSEQEVTLDKSAPKGKFNSVFGGNMELTGKPLTLTPWEYIVLTNN